MLENRIFYCGTTIILTDFLGLCMMPVKGSKPNSPSLGVCPSVCPSTCLCVPLFVCLSFYFFPSPHSLPLPLPSQGFAQILFTHGSYELSAAEVLGVEEK